MIKNQFLKNLYQAVSFFCVIMVLVVVIMGGFVVSIILGNPAWILLVFSLLMIFFYFAVGFYWIFQKIIISNFGIEVIFFNKVIKQISWENIESVEQGAVMKNPAYIIFVNNGKKLHLDSRKGIQRAIKHFCNDNAKLKF